MIRVNLLPPELRKKKAIPIIDVTLIYVIFAVILFFFLLNFITAQQKNKINALDRAIAQTNAEIAHYKEIINLVTEIEKVRETIQKRVGVIQELERKRFYWTRKFVELAQNVPDYLWLSTFYEEKDKITIKGSAFSIKSIATFIVQLLKNKVFDAVSLAFIKETATEMGKTYYFEMSTKPTAVEITQPVGEAKPPEKGGIIAKAKQPLADTAAIRREAAGLR